ncbi:unnamed protein product [Brassica oleracea]
MLCSITGDPSHLIHLPPSVWLLWPKRPLQCSAHLNSPSIRRYCTSSLFLPHKL